MLKLFYRIATGTTTANDRGVVVFLMTISFLAGLAFSALIK